MAKSTVSRRRNKSTSSKPPKPYDGFPLFPHDSGRWAKKVRQQIRFFGRWGHKRGAAIVPVEDVNASARAALEEFNRQWPFLTEGRTPPQIDSGNRFTVMDLCNEFLNAKLNLLKAGEITPRTFSEYHKTTDRILDAFGKRRAVDDLTAGDFAPLRVTLAKTRGPVALGNEIQRIRTVFKFAWDNRLIDRPVHYGTSFDKPSAKSIRKAQATSGGRCSSRMNSERLSTLPTSRWRQ